MHLRILCLTILTLSTIMAAHADTVYLKNGVAFDAVVTERPDGLYSVNAGGRILLYRPEEIDRIEPNDRTGALDKDEIKARWANQDAELTRLTGLNAEQRRKVDQFIYALQSDSAADRKTARDTLIAMHEEMDVFRYLAYRQPSLSHRLAPWVLEAMFFLDAARALEPLRENTRHREFNTRAKAIELLGRMRDIESAGLIARGLVDFKFEVRIMAAYALANLGARTATPALIQSLTHPDLRVSNAAREALQALWKSENGDTNPQTVDEWNALWAKRDTATLGEGISLATLEPLILPEEEFQNE
jgi:hypothetical protein